MNAVKERVVYGLIAALAGLLYWWLLTYFWAYWVLVNPIAEALLQRGSVNQYYRWVLHPTDWLTSVVISLPFGALLVRFARSHLWLCVAAASASSLVSVYWPGLLQPSSLLWAVALGLVMPLTFLPASVGLILLARRRFASNKSSKPTPLRGAA